jgi:hypothetical protein
MDLEGKRNSELRAMATELGAPLRATDDAMESADPHRALVDLVQSLLQEQMEPEPQPLDRAACERKKNSELVALARQAGANVQEIDEVCCRQSLAAKLRICKHVVCMGDTVWLQLAMCR